MPAAPLIEFASLATGALGFTIALAWNDAVSQTIKSMFPRSSAARATILYALVVTALVIAISICINQPTVRRALFAQDVAPQLDDAPNT